MIVWCATRFGWPPDVVRRQSMRDMRMLAAALTQEPADG